MSRPTGIVTSQGRDAGCAGAGAAPADALPPRHFRTTDRPRGGVLALGRQLLFANDDVRISVVTVGDTQGLTVISLARERLISRTARRGRCRFPGGLQWHTAYLNLGVAGYS